MFSYTSNKMSVIRFKLHDFFSYVVNVAYRDALWVIEHFLF